MSGYCSVRRPGPLFHPKTPSLRICRVGDATTPTLRDVMKNSSWFDTVTLLLISVMSIAAGVMGHVG